MKKKENNNFEVFYVNGLLSSNRYDSIDVAISENTYNTVMNLDRDKVYLIIPSYLKDLNQKIFNDLTVQEIFNAFINIKNEIIRFPESITTINQVKSIDTYNSLWLLGKYAILNNHDSMFLLEAKGIEKPKAFLMFSNGEIAEDISDNSKTFNDRALFYFFIWQSGPEFVKKLLSYKRDLDFIRTNNKALATEFREAFGGN